MLQIVRRRVMSALSRHDCRVVTALLAGHTVRRVPGDEEVLAWLAMCHQAHIDGKDVLAVCQLGDELAEKLAGRG